jgi:thiol-disulfide isomerase/thioredoxin
MKRIICSLIIAGCFTFMSPTAFAGQYPSTGDVFPEITLPVPKQSNDKAYLGITDAEDFTITQIKAPVIIIEIFSMYCPFCQKEAPLINELYELVQSKSVLKDKIKIIGIGAGNTQFEVDFFKSEYSIPFPLFPDESFSVHKAVGEVRTPYFFALQIRPDGSNEIIYSKAGSIHDPRAFLELIVKETVLAEEG